MLPDKLATITLSETARSKILARTRRLVRDGCPVLQQGAADHDYLKEGLRRIGQICAEIRG